MEAGQQERELQQANVNAAQGDADAQYVLGHRELFIIGGELKAEEGRLWLCRAAAQGHASAQYDLGLIYAGDLDRIRLTLTYDYPRDDAYAYKWLTLADRGGHGLAGSRLAELKKTISPPDKMRGEELLENWRTGSCGPPIIR
jgi:hypothetical protein